MSDEQQQNAVTAPHGHAPAVANQGRQVGEPLRAMPHELLPAPPELRPSGKRLIAVVGWAGVLALWGGLTTLDAWFHASRTGWLLVVVTIAGAGFLATVGGIILVSRRTPPWILLGLATSLLCALIFVDSVAR